MRFIIQDDKGKTIQEKKAVGGVVAALIYKQGKKANRFEDFEAGEVSIEQLMDAYQTITQLAHQRLCKERGYTHQEAADLLRKELKKGVSYVSPF